MAFPEDIPEYDVRFRVAALADGSAPSGKTFRWAPERGRHNWLVEFEYVESADDEWSDWFTVDAAANERAYNGAGHKGYPLTTFVRIFSKQIAEGATIEAEFAWAEEGHANVTLSWQTLRWLYYDDPNVDGPFYSLGWLVQRDGDQATGTPVVETQATYNAREFWSGVDLNAPSISLRFPLIDDWEADDAYDTWDQAFQALAHIGVNTIVANQPSPRWLAVAAARGLTQYAYTGYSPPGGPLKYGTANPADTPATDAVIADWAADLFDLVETYGGDPSAYRWMAIQDEPLVHLWTYATERLLDGSSEGNAALARFRALLLAAGLTPSDVGFSAWDDVTPGKRKSSYSTLAEKRLWYWSAAWFASESGYHFANCGQALADAGFDHPRFRAVVNQNVYWNRHVTPGREPGGNADQGLAQCATTMCDWEEAAARTGYGHHTEDWWPNGLSQWWSIQAAKCRAACDPHGQRWSAYLVGIRCDDGDRAVVQKLIALASGGASEIFLYKSGPNYYAPTEGYADFGILPKLQRALPALAFGEDLYLDGTRSKGKVALVHPYSSFPWDAWGITDPTGDDTLNSSTAYFMDQQCPEYMAEYWGHYYALTHAGYQVEILPERRVTAANLEPFAVVVVVGPCLPANIQGRLLAWAAVGGSLVLVNGAGNWDEYREDCTVFSAAIGCRIANHDPAGVPPPPDATGTLTYGAGSGTGRGAQGTWEAEAGTVLATRQDGEAALRRVSYGQGKVYVYSCFPGFSYWGSSNAYSRSEEFHPSGFNQHLRSLVAAPAAAAAARGDAYTDAALVETLYHRNGRTGLVTLLNWSNDPQSFRVTLTPGFTVDTVTSYHYGRELEFVQAGATLTLDLTVDAVDLLLLTGTLVDAAPATPPPPGGGVAPPPPGGGPPGKWKGRGKGGLKPARPKRPRQKRLRGFF
jgi:hypothetical protein